MVLKLEYLFEIVDYCDFPNLIILDNIIINKIIIGYPMFVIEKNSCTSFFRLPFAIPIYIRWYVGC